MRVVVVGGGVAGLAAAHRLRELAGPGLSIVLVEQTGRLGGKLRTGEIEGGPVEVGAEMFLAREEGLDSAVVRLARAVGLGDDLVHPAPLPAAIVVGGRHHRVPAGTLLGVPSDLSTVDDLARPDPQRDLDAGHPLLAPGEDDAVGALVRRRLGDEVVDRLVDPMLGGVYAGRADALSLAATMPGLHAAAQRQPTLTTAVRAALAAAPRPPGTPVFATVRGGVSRLVDAVAAAAGATVRLGAPVRELALVGAGWRLVLGSTRDAEAIEADAVVLAVPSAPAARLLREVDPGAAADVSTLEYASVALVTLALPAGTQLPASTGFLVPASEGRAVKAATYLSVKWPEQPRPDGLVLLRASVGRAGEVAVLQRSDEELISLVRGELAELVPVALPAPVAAFVTRWGGGLPQYGVGHVDRIRRVRAALPATLALAGAVADGVGIAACVRSGAAAAEAVWAALGAPDLGERDLGL
ncbi:MAG: protoporphyrinogen oxidase [Micromonosporaceae bacterium]